MFIKVLKAYIFDITGSIFSCDLLDRLNNAQSLKSGKKYILWKFLQSEKQRLIIPD